MYQTSQSTLPYRDRFAADGVETASNARILVMCYDRLDRDLAAAREAIVANEHFAANAALGHAQDLLGEMATMLDVKAWEHAPALLSIYDYLLRLLAVANMHKAESLVAEAQHLIGELGEAVRGAAAATSAPMPRPENEADGFDTEARVRLSVQA